MRKVYLDYVPHGINPKEFYPIQEGDKRFEEFARFNNDFLEKNNADFVIFWNNRNIRRKQPGDLILAFKYFCEKLLTPKQAKRACLLMHTQVRDDNGTDLRAVQEAIAPNLNVVFSYQQIDTKTLNFMYNMADVVVNIASNEGFGLSSAEAVMTGTPIINNTTGGLQDQMRFEDEKGDWIRFDDEFTSNHTGRYIAHGEWAKAVFPACRSLQGSIPTPYIFDDRCKFEDVAHAIKYWYDKTPEERQERGQKGREWLLSEECKMSSEAMCGSFIKNINFLFENWEPKKQFELHKVKKAQPYKHLGITW